MPLLKTNISPSHKSAVSVSIYCSFFHFLFLFLLLFIVGEMVIMKIMDLFINTTVNMPTRP